MFHKSATAWPLHPWKIKIFKNSMVRNTALISRKMQSGQQKKYDTRAAPANGTMMSNGIGLGKTWYGGHTATGH
jgi:hypothetical protein